MCISEGNDTKKTAPKHSVFGAGFGTGQCRFFQQGNFEKKEEEKKNYTLKGIQI